MSDLTEKFEQAAVDVKTLTSRPSNEDMLALYANFKQASKGRRKRQASWNARYDQPGQIRCMGGAQRHDSRQRKTELHRYS